METVMANLTILVKHNDGKYEDIEFDTEYAVVVTDKASLTTGVGNGFNLMALAFGALEGIYKALMKGDVPEDAARDIVLEAVTLWFASTTMDGVEGDGKDDDSYISESIADLAAKLGIEVPDAE